MVNVLVLDTNQRSALAVIRSLGKQPSVKIVGADSTIDSVGGSSKYCSRYIQSPSPAEDARTYVNWIEKILAVEAIDFIFPVTEITSQLLLMNPDRIPACKLPFAPYETVMSLAEKSRLVSLAHSLDVKTPKSQRFERAQDVNLDAQLVFPIVVKPCLSRIWVDNHWIHTAVEIVHSREELAQRLAESPWLHEHAFMLQEFIPGHGAGMFAIYDSGKDIAFFAHKRLREKPPGGGVSVLSESAPLSSTLLADSKKLLDAAGWHGVAMVEFRISDNGTPYLMEINTRFWGSLQLAIDAGVDFPALLLAISQKRPVSMIVDYKLGTRLRWLLGDIDSLYLVLKSSQYTLSFKLKRLLEFLTPHPFTTRHEVNRWGDLGPAVTELKQYIRAFKE